MAISSKKSLGKNSAYVQSGKGGKKRSKKKPGSSSIRSHQKTKKSTNSSTDAISTTSGNDFYSTFQDNTLETALAKRGFSQMRPEILGAFEFIPPLNADVDDTSQSQGQAVYDTSGAGELIDMQSQLKALRYKETMRFLRKKVGLKTRRVARSRKKFDTRDKFTKQIWMDWYNDTKKAESVLEFLSAALLIYDFKNVTDVKLNRYLERRFSRAKGGSAASIGVQKRLGKYNKNFISNKSPGILSLNDYLIDYLKYPEEYYKTVSSSALMMQLVADTAGRTIFPRTDMSNADTPSGEWSPGSLPGYDYQTKRTWKIVKQMKQIDETVGLVGSGRQTVVGHEIWDSDPVVLDVTDTGTDYFTKGDYLELYNIIATNKNPKPIYVVARDFMNHCVLSQNDSVIPGGAGSGMENAIKSLIGWNPSRSKDNIADIRSNVGDKIALDAFRKDIGDGKVVATFNEGWGDTNSGNKEMVTGQSFYADSFFKRSTSGVDKSIKRFATLGSDLETLTSTMYDFCKTFFSPKVGKGKTFENTRYRTLGGGSATDGMIDRDTQEVLDVQPIHLVGQSTVGRHGGLSMENPSSLFQRIYESIVDIITEGYMSPTNPGIGSNTGYAIVFACVNSRACAWKGLKWFWSYKRFKHSPGPTNQMNLRASAEIFTTAIFNSLELASNDYTQEGTMSERTLAFYGNGYDEDEVPIEWHNAYTEGDATYGGDASPIGQYFDNLGSERMDETWERLTCDYNGAWGSVHLGPLWDGRGKDRRAEMFDVLSGDSLGTVTAEDIGGKKTTNAMSFFDAIIDAVQDWEEAIIAEYEVPGIVFVGSKTKKTLGLSKHARLTIGWIILLKVFKANLTMCMPRTLFGSAAGHYRIGWSRRACRSLSDANQIKHLNPNRRTTTIADSKYNTIKGGEWDPGTGRGQRDAIEDCLDLFYTYFIPMAEWDVMVFNNLYYIVEVCDKVRSTINSIISTFSESDTANDLISEMKSIQADPKLSSILFSTLSPDQVRLSQYLYSSLAQSNRLYPYLPASSAFVTNTPKNLATISRIHSLLDTDDSGTKRIFTIGLPAGLVEFLRRAASRSLVDPDFNESTIVKISIWRRNLLTETTADVPVEYLFDLKRFMIDGRRSWPHKSSPRVSYSDAKEIDSAWQYFKGQTVSDLLKNAVILSYNRDGLQGMFQGQAYSRRLRAKASENGSLEALNKKLMPTCANVTGRSRGILDEIFHNHVIDYYLKVYLRLTTGVDMREETFCFNEEDTQITGPDDDLITRRDEWARLLKTMYGTRDMASSITYQRVLGELERSIFLSPEKYKNRIIYPKIFDRVFCVLVDDSWWESETPDSEEAVDFATGEMRSENISPESDATILSLSSKTNDPTYFQYYVTVSILSELNKRS